MCWIYVTQEVKIRFTFVSHNEIRLGFQVAASQHTGQQCPDAHTIIHTHPYECTCLNSHGVWGDTVFKESKTIVSWKKTRYNQNQIINKQTTICYSQIKSWNITCHYLMDKMNKLFNNRECLRIFCRPAHRSFIWKADGNDRIPRWSSWLVGQDAAERSVIQRDAALLYGTLLFHH